MMRIVDSQISQLSHLLSSHLFPYNHDQRLIHYNFVPVHVWTPQNNNLLLHSYFASLDLHGFGTKHDGYLL